MKWTKYTWYDNLENGIHNFEHNIRPTIPVYKIHGKNRVDRRGENVVVVISSS